ncbi:MAG: hypothetical protein WAU01_15545, partial [Saprospiraceae bacterium]
YFCATLGKTKCQEMRCRFKIIICLITLVVMHACVDNQIDDPLTVGFIHIVGNYTGTIKACGKATTATDLRCGNPSPARVKVIIFDTKSIIVEDEDYTIGKRHLTFVKTTTQNGEKNHWFETSDTTFSVQLIYQELTGQIDLSTSSKFGNTEQNMFFTGKK